MLLLFGFRTLVLRWHAARRLWSWLIFDVRQIMRARHQFLAQAKVHFAFLPPLGFHIETEREGTYASFKDGFEIVYASREVAVRVTYYDMEFEVLFSKGRIAAPYLFLDHYLHTNASGLAGCMFPFEKLAPVIESVAKDIETNYASVLHGDAAVLAEDREARISSPREEVISPVKSESRTRRQSQRWELGRFRKDQRSLTL